MEKNKCLKSIHFLCIAGCSRNQCGRHRWGVGTQPNPQLSCPGWDMAIVQEWNILSLQSTETKSQWVGEAFLKMPQQRQLCPTSSTYCSKNLHFINALSLSNTIPWFIPLPNLFQPDFPTHPPGLRALHWESKGKTNVRATKMKSLFRNYTAVC